MKKVVVTGATSGLGLTACEMLLEQGVEVIGIGRQVDRIQHLLPHGLKFRQTDISNVSPEQLERVMNGADAVWHCAARSSPWGAQEDFYRDNVIGTKNVVAGAQGAGVQRFVHVSTPAVYFNYQHRRDVRENQTANRMVNHYAETKLRAEHIVTATAQDARGSFNAVVIRPRALFGPNDRTLLPRLLRAAKENGGKLPLPNRGHTLLDLTYMDNVVAAMWRASTAFNLHPVEVLNITNGEPVILGDVLRNFSAMLGHPFKVTSAPYFLMSLAASIQEMRAEFTRKEPRLTRYGVGVLAYDMTLDISRARKVLAYTPHISVEEGLARTVAAMKAAQGA